MYIGNDSFVGNLQFFSGNCHLKIIWYFQHTNQAMKVYFLFFIICISNISIAQEQNDKIFPDYYFGKYNGDLIIASDNGQQKVPMEFHLLESEYEGKNDYTIIFGEGENKQTRSYTLLEKNASKGNYILDENNGILLETKVITDKMFSIFEVEGTLITTYISFGDDQLIFEVVAAQIENKTVSGELSEDIPEVFSYPVGVVQRAILFKE